MTAADLIGRLRGLDITVELDGEKLRLKGPTAALTPELHAELKERRDELAELLAKVGAGATGAGLVPLQAEGVRAPFFVVPGHNGDVFCFRPLTVALGGTQPLFAYQPPGVDGREKPLERVEELAERFLADVVAQQRGGPYSIGGYCTGGVIAFEAAQLLRARGEEVASLVLLGTPSVAGYRLSHRLTAAPVRAVGRALRVVRGEASAAPPPALPEPESDPEDRARVERATIAAVRAYEPRPYPGRMVLFLPSQDRRAMYCERYMDWSALAGGGLTVHAGSDGTLHSRMLRPPAVHELAPILEAELGRAGS